MRNYEERAKDFIREVFDWIDNWHSPYCVRSCIQSFNKANSRNVKVVAGLARIALITSDYVVKFEYDPEEVACIGGCQNEMDLYAIAEREGFAYLLAKITHFEYCGYDFYIMPRINGVGSCDWEYADDFMNHAEQAFCLRHHVTDLHCNNFGFRKGHVCLIDYACRLAYASSSEDTDTSV